MNAFTRILSALDLCGKDGRPSFTKLLIVALFIAFCAKAGPPELVAIAMLGASFGRVWVQNRGAGA